MRHEPWGSRWVAWVTGHASSMWRETTFESKAERRCTRAVPSVRRGSLLPAWTLATRRPYMAACTRAAHRRRLRWCSARPHGSIEPRSVDQYHAPAAGAVARGPSRRRRRHVETDPLIRAVPRTPGAALTREMPFGRDPECHPPRLTCARRPTPGRPTRSRRAISRPTPAALALTCCSPRSCVATRPPSALDLW